MKRKTLAVGAATLAALVTVGACSNTSTTQGDSPSSVSAPSADTEAHNQADAMFTQHMIPHHQQAIEMSDMLLGKQGIDPRVLDLAKQIKAAQAPEIEQMQNWLTQWGMPTMPMMPGMEMPGHSGMPSATPSEPGAPTHSMMPGPGMSDIPGMDGMMSEEDMAALKNAQGVEASKLYLTQMIKHHEGAITMAQNEIKDGQYPDTIALARSIVTSQQQEIDTMNKILASL
ncbi:MAG: DUF305 domain-containing protein [Mycobacterium sp.]